MSQNDLEFEKKLHLHLKKCEIEFIAKNRKTGGYIPALQQGMLQISEIEDYIKEIGFKIKERFESDNWIVTSNNIAVSLEDGFICKQK